MLESVDIITVGEGLVELSCETSLKFAQSFDKFYGGDSLTTAISALRMGSNAMYITKLGSDNFCEFLLEAWGCEGLNTSQVKLTNGQNGIYFIGKKDNNPEFMFYRNKTAGMQLCVDDINFDCIKNAKCVYATGFVQSLSLCVKEAVKEIFKFAKENDVLVAYDPNIHPSVMSQQSAQEAFDEVAQYIDIMFLNTKVDSKVLFETQSVDRILQVLSDRGIQVKVIREHKNGIHIQNSINHTFVEYKNDNVVDDTGWEDAFNGAFLSYYLKGNDTIKCAQLANALSLLQIQKVGAIKSIPNKIDTEKLCGELYG